MTVNGIFKVLSTIGDIAATVGTLLTRLGFALSPPNLGDTQGELNLDLPPRMGQDPLAQGAEDEKPARRKSETSFTSSGA